MMDQFEEKYGGSLKRIEDRFKEQDAKDAQEAVYSALAEKYGDKFNRKGVEGLYDELYSGDLNTLGEILQSAHLGRSATQNDPDPPSGAGRADSIPSGGGVATITAPEISPKTSDEAEAMAKADLGISEEDY